MLTFLHLRYQISICTIQISAHHFPFPYTRCLPCTAHMCGPAVDEQSKGCSWFPWPFLPALLYLEQDFKYTQASHSYFPAVRAAALCLSVRLSPLTWAKQTSIWEIPPAPTAQKFRQKLFTGSAGTAAHSDYQLSLQGRFWLVGLHALWTIKIEKGSRRKISIFPTLALPLLLSVHFPCLSLSRQQKHKKRHKSCTSDSHLT